MNYNMRQQDDTLTGLFNLIGGIMGQNARQRGEVKNYQAQQDFANQINALDYGNQTTTQDLASRANPNSNYINKTAETQTQGLLPTGFSQYVPTSDALGQGLLGQAMQQPITRNVQAPQQVQQPVNDLSITNPMDKYSAENNPVSTTTSAPKTIQQQTAMIKSQIPTAMKELIAKGYNPKDILPLLQQVATDKIAEHTATYNQNMVNDLYTKFSNAKTDNEKIAYGSRLKQLGYDVIGASKEFATEYKPERFDNGSTNDAYSFNPKTGKYELQVSMAKSVTPDAQLKADTSIKTTQMNNDNRITVKGMVNPNGRTTGTGNSRTEKINGMTNLQINNEISKYKQWKAKNPDSTIDEYPRQAQYEDAADPYGNSRNADLTIEGIKQAYPDATDEQIFQFLNDRLQRG